MGKYDRLPCAFCNHQPGEWKRCPNCGAPKTGTGTWLAERWKVPLAKRSARRFQAGTAFFHRDGHYWNRLKNFPGALFDTTGYVLFQDENEYLSCSSITVKSQTNLAGPVTILSQVNGYVVGQPVVVEGKNDSDSNAPTSGSNQLPNWLSKALNDADN